jgi:acyl transferase domain-containing protein
MIPREAEKSSTPATSQLLIFSANHPESLRRMVENYETYLTKSPQSLADLSYTLGSRREHLLHRAFCVTSPGETLTVSTVGKTTSVPQIALIFTGQGAQWPQMGASLMKDFPVFRETIRQLDKHLSTLTNGPQWTIEGSWHPLYETLLILGRGNCQGQRYQLYTSSRVLPTLLYRSANRSRQYIAILGHLASSRYRSFLG